MADLNEKFKELNNTPDTTSEFDQQDIVNNKAMAILSYLSWLVLIPLIGAKGSKFARFHCNQGLVLAIVEIVIGVVLGFFGDSTIISLVKTVINLACLALSVIGIINAVNGKAKELPIIGKFKILK